ncbi:MAG: helix-turn-helix domain-containing protein [Bacteroidales bacterium]|nr:helix-turn-helix domain-containing protein [Bacteroidales bacterium]
MEKENSIIMGETLFPDCPVRNILSRVGDKWSLLLMHHIMHHPEPMRFSDLRKAIPDISQKVLTSTLRNLEADGFIVRRVYAQVPPRTDYALTPRAHSFMNACRPMVQWAIDNFAAIMNDRNRKRQN